MGTPDFHLSKPARTYRWLQSLGFQPSTCNLTSILAGFPFNVSENSIVPSRTYKAQTVKASCTEPLGLSFWRFSLKSHLLLNGRPLPDAIHSTRPLLDTTTDLTSYERVFTRRQKSGLGVSTSTGLSSPGSDLMCRPVKSRKYGTSINEAESPECNHTSCHNGRKEFDNRLVRRCSDSALRQAKYQLLLLTNNSPRAREFCKTGTVLPSLHW